MSENVNNEVNVVTEAPKTESAPEKQSRIRLFFKRLIVTLKYRTKIIPILVLLVGFVMLSFRLTDVSETTLYIGYENMALLIFTTYLLSILSLVCLLNAFPKREKPKIAFIVLTFVLLAVVILCDVLYILKIEQKVADMFATVDQNTGLNQWQTLVQNGSARPGQINSAESTLTMHVVFEAVGFALIALLPLLKKLFGLINTRVVIEENENMGNIDLSEDETK